MPIKDKEQLQSKIMMTLLERENTLDTIKLQLNNSSYVFKTQNYLFLSLGELLIPDYIWLLNNWANSL